VWSLCTTQRVWLRAIIVAFALIIALPIGLFWSTVVHEAHMRIHARTIEAQLESYRSLHGKYPVSLSELGIREVNGPIYYDRDFDSPLVYHLWFGLDPHFGMTYDSATQKWHYDP
jgi:hypothetical protein